jgi:hypothetical protein
MTSSHDHHDKLPGVKESRFALNFESGFQSIGFAVLLCIILAALLGLFSNGYFSSAQKSTTSQTLSVNYERFGRLQTEFKLHFTVRPQNTDKYVVSLGGKFNEDFQSGSISPQPDSMYSRGNTLYLVYNDVNNKRDFNVWMYVTPTVPGKSVSSVSVNDQPDITFWQFIYP